MCWIMDMNLTIRTLWIWKFFFKKVFNTENVPSLAKLKEKRKIKSANISDESVINKITGDSYLVVIKVENVMTFKTSVFNYDSWYT
jgi:hypothetical protein